MFKRLIAATLLFAGLVGTVGAASVREMLLDEIIDTSAVAFQGICTSNRTERDALSNFVVTYTTFDVTDVLKGNVLATHTIKQIGGRMPDGEGFRVDGVPTFSVGAEYVVFLAGVSSLGFSSPIGLAQGKFTVRGNESGKIVSNGRDFRELTARMPPDELPTVAAPARSLSLDAFKRQARSQIRSARE